MLQLLMKRILKILNQPKLLNIYRSILLHKVGVEGLALAHQSHNSRRGMIIFDRGNK